VIAGKSSKSQAPSSREIPNYKLQMSKGNAPLQVGTSVIEICLELGIWSLAEGAQEFEMQM
jgi:hypothetical protein